MNTYIAGWYLRGKTAVFQFVKNKDMLSCELMEYLGERITSKKGARERLNSCKSSVLKCLQEKYPDKNICNIVVE